MSVTNGISLLLVRVMVRETPVGVQFLFVMALVCAALTTLNTYIITFQQLYYEFSLRLNANRFWTFVFSEFLLKWGNVRGVSLAVLGVAFVGSLILPERYVYAFGVGSLATVIFAVPVLLNELPAVHRNDEAASHTRWARRAHLYLWGAIALCAAFLVIARICLGSITQHLYVIPAAAIGASVVLWQIVAVSPERKRPEEVIE